MNGAQIIKIEVVTTLLIQGQKILTVFNPKWGAFTFPMSKRKFLKDLAVSAAPRPEALDRAAARVAAEVLGRTFVPAEFSTLDQIKGFEQSDADGVWKLYDFHLFTLKVSDGVKLAPGLIAEWLAPQELQSREPVTHTARYLVGCLEEKGLLAKALL